MTGVRNDVSEIPAGVEGGEVAGIGASGSQVVVIGVVGNGVTGDGVKAAGIAFVEVAGVSNRGSNIEATGSGESRVAGWQLASSDNSVAEVEASEDEFERTGSSVFGL